MIQSQRTVTTVSAGVRSLIMVALLAFALSVGAERAEAGCDVIPPAVQAFRASRGTTDRPFARPGDWVRLALDPTCDAGAAGFGPASNLVVSVVFRPPGGGPRNVVALATNCAGVDTASCAALPDVANATCVTVNGAGNPAGLERIDSTTLRFRFPDSDALFMAANDDFTFTGPATIAVSTTGNPLPCGLAASTCANTAGLLACIDELYAENGTCNQQPSPTFPHFTALPPPNDYQGLCTTPAPPCTGLVDEVRFAVDAGGNILLPMDWRGVRVDRDAVPVARLLRATSTVEAYEGRGVPLRITDLQSLGSFSPEGVKLPPLFDPQSDPTTAATATFFGSTDAAETVLRIARHRIASKQCVGGINDELPCRNNVDCPGATCAPPVCTAGSNAGSACSLDFECPGGECGPGLFDFSTRLLADAGPIVLRLGACIGGANALAACTNDSQCSGGQCGAFTLTALDPVPLDGLNQSDDLNAFVMHESIAQPPADLNGDGDTSDPVIKLSDRVTGNVEAIGIAGSEGRAVARVQQPPFSFPVLAVDEDVVAFLEPEPWQAATDANANARRFDTILRVYRLGMGEATNASAPIAADAAPLVNDRSLAISDAMVFFRSSEAANATQQTTRVSVDSAGNQAMGATQDPHNLMPSLSADGRYVAFFSHATNLVPNDTFNLYDVFVHDRVTGATTRVSVSGSGAQAAGPSYFSPFLSGDGRYVAFASGAPNLVVGDTDLWQDIFVHDRDADADGNFDETGPGERATVRVSVASDGTQANFTSWNDVGSISPDGRFVVFYSEASNLVAGDGNGVRDVFVHDRDADADGIFDETGPGQRATVRASVDSNGNEGSGRSTNGTASADGRYVTFESEACNLIPGDCVATGDTNGVTDVFLRDRDVDEDGVFDEPGAVATTRVSVDATGTQGNGASFEPRISADSSTIVFTSLANNLVAGDTNGFRDIFAFERATGRITVLTVSPGGQVGTSNSGSPTVSGDGRFVTFDSRATNLTTDVTTSIPKTYLHDRLTRLTTLLSLNVDGLAANHWMSPPPSISLDGTTVAFASYATDLVPGDTNGYWDIFVRGPAPGSGDLSGDGLADDTILRALDTTTGSPATIVDLCPAGRVAVAAGRAAFLRPEGAGTSPNLAACPTGPLVAGKPDLNGDSDATDDVVHLWNGTAVQNLGRAAVDIALSDSWVAARLSEAGDGGTNLNGDADASDTVVHVHPVVGGAWTNVGQAADSLALEGDLAAFLTPEAAQGGDDLNDDSDSDDRVVQTYDAATSTLSNTGQAAEEIVLGSAGLVAFRTLEARQGAQDLNGDSDTADGVLQVYDAATDMVINSGHAVTPCRLEACNPRVPYRVGNDTVTFLTLEADQGEDLNNDGDIADLVLQVLNVRQGCSGSGGGEACHTLAAASAGICTDTAAACADDGACPGGECFVPPGGCLRNLGNACNPVNGSGCVVGPQFCQPILGAPSMGTCYAIENACTSDAACAPGVACSRAGQDFQRLVNPLADVGGGTSILTSAGRCIEDRVTACTVSSQCETGEFCNGATCKRQHGVCAGDADCPTGAVCRPDLLTATADDADLDELPDAIDNCAHVANIVQEDTDGDGAGDACDLASCGNGVVELDEECDDGNVSDGDGCESDCRLVTVLVPGSALVVQHRASGERSVSFGSRGEGLTAPVGAGQDPTVVGAQLDLFNEITGERASIELPASNWTGLGAPAGSRGYKYRDRYNLLGPCRVALFKPGKILKAICRGSDIDFSLDEAQQGTLNVSVRFGAGSGALKFCTSFGGTVVADWPLVGDAAGRFKARKALPPAACPG